MCFKTEIHLTRTEIETRFNRRMDPSIDFEPRYYISAFDFPQVPVMTVEQPNLISIMHWGLIPSWVRDEQKAKELRLSLLNARSESILEKVSFRHAAESNRCLIVSHGYYEWQHRGKVKTPYYIKLKSDELFAIAGIYDKWLNEKTGEEIKGFSLLTRDAIPFIANIHNSQKRMPYILPKELENMWIDSSIETQHILNNLKTLNDNDFVAWPINDLINSSKENKNLSKIIEPRNEKSNPEQLSLF